MNKKILLLLNLIVFIMFSSFVISVSKNNEEKNPAKKESSNIKVSISADHLVGDDKNNFLKLWGNVKIQQEDAVLNATEAIYYTKEKKAIAQEGIKFTRPGSTLTGDKITVYYDEKRAVIEGNVKIIQEKTQETKSKQEERVLKEGPVTIQCDEVEVFWKKPRKVIARKNLKADQKDKHLTADQATYTEEPQKLVLEGNVHLSRDDGSWLKCNKMTLMIKEETVEAEGAVEGSFLVEKEKEE